MQAANKALAEAEASREIIRQKDEQLNAKDEIIKAKDATIAIEKERADSWAKAALERKAAITLDEKMIASFERSIQDFTLERARLIGERDSARSANKFWGFAGLVLGGILGHQIAK